MAKADRLAVVLEVRKRREEQLRAEVAQCQRRLEEAAAELKRAEDAALQATPPSADASWWGVAESAAAAARAHVEQVKQKIFDVRCAWEKAQAAHLAAWRSAEAIRKALERKALERRREEVKREQKALDGWVNSRAAGAPSHALPRNGGGN